MSLPQSSQMPQSGGWHRYRAAAFAGPRTFDAALDQGKVIDHATIAATHPLFPVARGLVAQLMFIGAGADGDEFDYRVWAFKRLHNALDSGQSGGDRIDPVTQGILQFLGSGTATLGDEGGLANGRAILSTEQIADGLTFTPSTDMTTPTGPLTDFQTAFDEGAAGVFSPGDDTPAILALPHLIRASALIIDFAIGEEAGDADSANCLVSVAGF